MTQRQIRWTLRWHQGWQPRQTSGKTLLTGWSPRNRWCMDNNPWIHQNATKEPTSHNHQTPGGKELDSCFENSGPTRPEPREPKTIYLTSQLLDYPVITSKTNTIVQEWWHCLTLVTSGIHTINHSTSPLFPHYPPISGLNKWIVQTPHNWGVPIKIESVAKLLNTTNNQQVCEHTTVSGQHHIPKQTKICRLYYNIQPKDHVSEEFKWTKPLLTTSPDCNEEYPYNHKGGNWQKFPCKNVQILCAAHM